MSLRPETFPLPLKTRTLSPAELDSIGSKVQLYQVEAPFIVAPEGFEPTEVPVGYITDFASIPRPVWSIIAPEDPIIQMPSLGHDQDYTLGKDRDIADRKLRQAMLDAGAPAWKAWAVWKAVSLFGGSHWRGKK